MSYCKTRKMSVFYRFVSCFVAIAFLFTAILPPAYAQTLNLPVPGTMVNPGPAFMPVLLKGMTIHPENPLRFDFIVDSGNTEFTAEQVKKDAERLVKYFLAAMTVPQDDLWVNLSPYEQNRIIPDELGKTELGRDMLAQDYILKQLTATLVYPEKELGREFWEKVYARARDEYGTSEIPVDTFNKVWIVPQEATVYEHNNAVYVTNSRLKVMLDSDYLALQNAKGNSLNTKEGKSLGSDKNDMSKEILREVILPEIEREVNEGENFAPIRQIYHSLILAQWYKETIKEGLLTQVYVNQKKIKGVDLADPDIKDEIYARYIRAFKKGVFDIIKEDYDALSKEVIPRKYFSGGLDKFGHIPLSRTADSKNVDSAMIGDGYELSLRVDPVRGDARDAATLTSPVFDLKDPHSKEVLAVGGKAASLHELASIPGIKTPDGFSVSTKVYEEYVKAIGVESLIKQLEKLSEKWKGLYLREKKLNATPAKNSSEASKRELQLEKIHSEMKSLMQKIEPLSEEIMKKFSSGEINENHKAGILKQYESLGRDTRVAVRSSATAEDMPNASFAGQYDSYLNRSGEEQLLQSIKDVWASTYTLNAVNYRNKNNIQHNKTKMGVLILEMVDAYISGVAFTVDSQTGMSMISMDETYGLGELIVSGKVSTDSWIIDPTKNTIVKRSKGKKEKRRVYDSERGENIDIINSKRLRRSYSITSEKAREIAAQIKLIHDYYVGKSEGEVLAIDVEYALTEDGQIFFTQVRPETVGSKGKLSLAAIDQKKLKKEHKQDDYPLILEGGITGSPGVASGPLKVVATVDEAKQRVKPGDVLVAPDTTNVWEPAIGLAVSVVTERGSKSSHTAVVSREQGKPAIVASAGAMAILRKYEGQVVTIDSIFNRIYLGEIPEEYYFRPTKIPTHYGQRDNETEEEHWQGASANDQTMEVDGQRWLGRVKETRSPFFKFLAAKSYAGIADRFNLSPISGRSEEGVSVYRILFSDLHKNREELRGKSLEWFEDFYEKRKETVDRYLETSRRLELSRTSLKEWIQAYVALNGFMDISFNVHKVLEGMLDEELERVGVQEPYLSQVRVGMSALYGETMATRSLQDYKRIYDRLDESPHGNEFVAALTAIGSKGEYPSALLTNQYHKDFYDSLQAYASNYRERDLFSLDFSDSLPVKEVAEKLLKDYEQRRVIGINSPMPEDFFPEDEQFQRISRLALLSDKLRQDSHHLMVRGQWRFIHLLNPFIAFLISKGELRNPSDLYLHDPEFLLNLVGKYQKEIVSLGLFHRDSMDMEPYRTYSLLEHEPFEMEGISAKILARYRGEGVSPDLVANLENGLQTARGMASKRYASRKEEWASFSMNVSSQKKETTPAQEFVLHPGALHNRILVQQKVMRHFERNALSLQSDEEKAVADYIFNIEDILTFLSMDAFEKAKYLYALIESEASKEIIKVYVQTIISNDELETILRWLEEYYGVDQEEIGEWREMYNKRPKSDALSGVLLQHVDRLGRMDKIKDGRERLSDLTAKLIDNLELLRNMYSLNHPGEPEYSFYRFLINESHATGTSLALLLIGITNLNQPTHLVDRIVSARRVPVPDLESSSIDYVYFGGGGKNASSIARSARNRGEQAGLRRSDLYAVNIVGVFDMGGFTGELTNAVRRKFLAETNEDVFMVAQADYMDVISWNSVSSAHWQRHTANRFDDYKPENEEAIMDLLYVHRNRIQLKREETLADKVKERIIAIDQDPNFQKPAGWYEFVVNLMATVRIVDEQLIAPGYLNVIYDKPASIQDVFFAGLFLSYHNDALRAAHEGHQAVGLKQTQAVPVTHQRAILGLQLSGPEGREIVGQDFISNGYEHYRGESAFEFHYKREDPADSGSIVTMTVSDEHYPQAAKPTLDAVDQARQALVFGMGSPFDSLLVTLMPKGVVQRIKQKVRENHEVPSVFFPKLTEELQTAGLGLREIFEVFERSLQVALKDPGFRIQDVFSHVVVPGISDEIRQRYLEYLKDQNRQYVNDSVRDRFNNASNADELTEILTDSGNWNEKTKKMIREYRKTVSKLIPGKIFDITKQDREFLRKRGIQVVEPTQEEEHGLFRFWEGRLHYNTDMVLDIVDRVAGDYAMLANVSSHIGLSEKEVDDIVGIASEEIRKFYKEIEDYAKNPEGYVPSDLRKHENLLQAARDFHEDPDKFSDQNLLNVENGIPRIEVRRLESNGEVLQIAVSGIPGRYREKVKTAFDGLLRKYNLSVTNGGAMTIEFTRKGVDKALPLDYLARHYDEILNAIGYSPGDLVDARETRTVLISDGDGVIYGAPTEDSFPSLSESPVQGPLVKYLEAGGLLVVNSGYNAVGVVERLLRDGAISGELYNRIIICGNKGAIMGRINSEGSFSAFDSYFQDVLEEEISKENGSTIGTLDAVYVGDTTAQTDNDYPPSVKIGFKNAVTVTGEDFENIPSGFRPNYIGGFEQGMAKFLRALNGRIKSNRSKPLFGQTELGAIIDRARDEDKINVTEDELHELMKYFGKEMRLALDGQQSSVPMMPSLVPSATGKEQGEFISLEWGGTHVRIRMVRLEPGKEPEVKLLLSKRFTNRHKVGLDDPFVFVAKQLKSLNLPDKDYKVGFAFSQPIIQGKNPSSGLLFKWSTGWNIPDVVGKDAGLKMQEAINKEGMERYRIVATMNDVVAVKQSIPEADIGLVIGTGLNFGFRDKSGKLYDSEMADLAASRVPQTAFDRNINLYTDPVERHAIEKMVSGNYIGMGLRLRLRALRDREKFMANIPFVPLLDAPYRLHPGEFSDQNDLEELLGHVFDDAKELRKRDLSSFENPKKALEWLLDSPVIFQVFERKQLEDFLSPVGKDLYNKILAQFNLDSLSSLTPELTRAIVRNPMGQKFQRIILDLLHPEFMPEDQTDVFWTTLISFIDKDEHDNLDHFREELGKKLNMDLHNVTDADLRLLREESNAITRRAGRLVAALMLQAVYELDEDLSSDHIIAVDGGVYARHPKIHIYIDEEIAKLRKMNKHDKGGKIEFRLSLDAVGIGSAYGAAIAAAMADSAMISDVGGIDMNRIDLNRQGRGVEMEVDPVLMQDILNNGVDGFIPVIINLTPINSVLPFLGLGPEDGLGPADKQEPWHIV